MLPTKFRFIWTSASEEKIVLEIDKPETISAFGGQVCKRIGTILAGPGMLQRMVQGTTWAAFHFFQFLSNDDGRCMTFSLNRNGKLEQGEPVC
jgi:hypothetical protein